MASTMSGSLSPRTVALAVSPRRQTSGDMGGVGIDDFPKKDLVTDGKGGNFHMNLNRT
jgi:hypothetical protein